MNLNEFREKITQCSCGNKEDFFTVKLLNVETGEYMSGEFWKCYKCGQGYKI